MGGLTVHAALFFAILLLAGVFLPEYFPTFAGCVLGGVLLTLVHAAWKEHKTPPANRPRRPRNW